MRRRILAYEEADTCIYLLLFTSGILDVVFHGRKADLAREGSEADLR
jgi:hypothetical protein